MLTLFMMLPVLALQAQDETLAFPDYLDGEGDDELEMYEVDNAIDFIKALGSNRQITIAENTTINLSRVLENESLFLEEDSNRDWVADADELVTSVERVLSEEVEDGYQLVLMNVENLYIIGKFGAEIVVEPRYANLFTLKNCVNICFNNLKLGHTEGYDCFSNVVKAENCNIVYFDHCELNSLGNYGVSALNVDDLTMVSSTIHECSDGIMDLNYCHRSSFRDCDFYNNCGGVWSYLSTDTRFRDCHFFRNLGKLFCVDKKTMIDNCEMWHPTADRGNENVLSFEELDYFWNDEWGENVERRNIGPR